MEFDRDLAGRDFAPTKLIWNNKKTVLNCISYPDHSLIQTSSVKKAASSYWSWNKHPWDEALKLKRIIVWARTHAHGCLPAADAKKIFWRSSRLHQGARVFFSSFKASRRGGDKDGRPAAAFWTGLLLISTVSVASFYITRCFEFSKYNTFIIYLYIVYV